jgi:hypothetical protein
MPRSTDLDDSLGGDAPKMGFWERIRYAMVKHDTAVDEKAAAPAMSVDELEEAIARANDKERAVGLAAAPLGAIIALTVGSAEINHAHSLNQSTSTYEELLIVLAGMAVLMLVTAWLRKRLFLGIAMALFGLGIFNLHFWGFGIPFIMGGAWLLVRAYRLQQQLKLADPDGSGGSGGKQATSGRTPGGKLPRPNKRYTPRTAPLRRPSKPKP